jgi:colicin import membrane protein
MKHLLACALALFTACAVQAQDVPAERERIRSERAAADAHFLAAQRECRGRFSVNDCLRQVKREHAAVVGDLRRQELVLNDAERRRRAAERQQAVDERNAPEKQQQAEERRARSLQDQQNRERRAGEKAGKRATDDAERAQHGPRAPKTPKGSPQPQGDARTAHPSKPNGPTPEEAAKNRREHEARLKEAQQHKAEVEARVAKRRKPAASELPVPVH